MNHPSSQKGKRQKTGLLILGATGLIGTEFIARYGSEYQLYVVSRNPQKAKERFGETIEVLPWQNPTDWVKRAGQINCILNLAGESIAGFWSAKRKERILESRIEACNKVLEFLRTLPARERPERIVQASAVGYYGSRGDEILYEDASAGKGFLAKTCEKWEEAAARYENEGLREIRGRIGIVLSKKGGILKNLLPVFRMFMGGHPGSGEQFIPWIHVADVAGAFHFLLQHKDISGPVNISGPEPVRAKEFYETLARYLGRPSWLHPPAFLLKLGSKDMANELLLASQRAVPERLLKAGYSFQYKTLNEAIAGALDSEGKR